MSVTRQAESAPLKGMTLSGEVGLEFAQLLRAVLVSLDLGVRIRAELDAIDAILQSAPQHSSHFPNPYPAGGR